jgi:hypothetical protein
MSETDSIMVQLQLDYEQVLDLVEQLPKVQREHLVARLLAQPVIQPELTLEEKLRRLDEAILDNPVLENPSPRREDWYDDDGR